MAGKSKRSGLGPMVAGLENIHVLQKTTPEDASPSRDGLVNGIAPVRPLSGESAQQLPPLSENVFSAPAVPVHETASGLDQTELGKAACKLLPEKRTTVMLPPDLNKKMKYASIDNNLSIKDIMQGALEVYLPLLMDGEFKEYCSRCGLTIGEAVRDAVRHLQGRG